MTRIGIIGGGIAGLGCAYLLHRDHDITLFDRNGYAGGHTNTVSVDEDGREVPIDTGFMVFNEVTYPNLTRLFAELGVETMRTDMSFGVQHLPSGIAYCGSSVNQLFAQRRNLFRPRFLRALGDIGRFNREAGQALATGECEGLTLDEYCAARGYGEDFTRLYLRPITAAVWSMPFETAGSYPAATLLRFFANHGLLGGLKGHHQWLTVRGGAKRYVEAMTRGFRDRIRLGTRVVSVERPAEGGAVVRLADGTAAAFDKVILACHADEALTMLADPTADERRLLGKFAYQRNVATLHTDSAVMPRNRRAWASWNVRVDETSAPARSTTIYWMNSLQNVSQKRDYFVSIDDPGVIDHRRVIRTIEYHHPLFTVDAMAAQAELPRLNAIGPAQSTYFCGSYFRYGFHEDAFTSAIDASRAVSESVVRRENAA